MALGGKRPARRVVVTVAAVAVCFALEGCTMLPSPDPTPTSSAPPASTPAQLRDQLVRLVDATIAAAPATEWKHDTEANNPDASTWDPSNPSFGYGTCDTDGQGRYRVALFGAPALDPEAAAEQVAAAWEAPGVVVSTVVPTQPVSAERYTEVRADHADGALVGFTASDTITAIGVYTSCTTDDQALLDGVP